MTTKVTLKKILSFKSGQNSNGKNWQALEVFVSYKILERTVDVILSFNGKSDIERINKYAIGTVFNTDIIPKTVMYDSGKTFTTVYGWGSFTDENIENFKDIRSKEESNPFSTQ
jgi:hypothetical protein